jgi:hypothetical protein
MQVKITEDKGKIRGTFVNRQGGIQAQRQNTGISDLRDTPLFLISEAVIRKARSITRAGFLK